jgi:hypothetical protein
LGWLRLTARLGGMSLDEVKMKTSASQFVLWMEFLDWEANAFNPSNYYMAQIAAEVRRSFVKPGTTVEIEDFIMKFKQKRTRRTRTTSTNKIKQFFFGLTGLIGRGKRK